MQNMEQQDKKDFVIEKIKERPVNRKKLVRRSFITAAMAVLFGLIACFTFLVLEPVISNWLYPQEGPNLVIFPEEQEEMEPEEMLSDNIPVEATAEPTITSKPIFPSDAKTEQMQELLNYITLDVEHFAQMYKALNEQVKELNRYMVTITAVEATTDWLQNVTKSQTIGSGVVIGNNGKELLILTNYNYLKNADSLQATFSNGASVEAKIKQQHIASDVVVLSVNLNILGNKIESIPIATFGSTSTQSLLCTPVVAMGNPMGEQGSIGYGMITSESGQITMVDANYKLLMTDIYGSQNASGFLFNLKGQVIGMITTRKNTSDMRNMITAYAISDLKKIISNLSKGTRIAYLGITGTDVSQEANMEGQVPLGVYVKDVAMGSPAMQAGIQPGDIITGMGNTVVSNFVNYFSAITNMESGETVRIRIMRQFQSEYKEMEFNIVLEAAE
ncbi:MAG: serine protease [Lachnospiraceae bacterium]|nr:serine protease [Lachnospiraceae bacterium]